MRQSQGGGNAQALNAPERESREHRVLFSEHVGSRNHSGNRSRYRGVHTDQHTRDRRPSSPFHSGVGDHLPFCSVEDVEIIGTQARRQESSIPTREEIRTTSRVIVKEGNRE